MTNYTPLKHCVACGNTELSSIINLGNQPLANNYHTGDCGERYPLELMRCKTCWHTQLSVAVEPRLMFKHYLYVTGTSQTLRDYCDWFAMMISLNHPRLGKVLDIASNDGTQLNSFKKMGWETWGIEPASNLIHGQQHKIINDFAENVNMPEQFDVITAQNVMAHTQYPLEILRKIKTWLKPNGTVYIQTSQANMFINGEFDTIYHEHISFFCANSMAALCSRAGLKLIDVQYTDIHGTSYLFIIKHQGKVRKKLINVDAHRYHIETYEDFKSSVVDTLAHLRSIIDHYKSQNYKIIGYGAAAKGMTVINAGSIYFDWIVDDNPLKVNKLTPGTNTDILSSASLNTDDPMLIVPLAWNFFDEIKQRVSKIRNNSKTAYCRYFPEVQLYESIS